MWYYLDSSGTCGIIYNKYKEWRAMDIEETLYHDRVDELMRQIQTLKEELVYEKEQRDQVLRDSYFKTGKDSFVNGEDNVRGES